MHYSSHFTRTLSMLLAVVFTAWTVFGTNRDQALPQAAQAVAIGKAVTGVASVTVSPSNGNQDDTARLQKAIDETDGRLVFDAGTYRLKRPLHLRSARAYVGAGSWDSRYGSILIQQTPGEAIFAIDGPVDSVTIGGLTFGGARAKAIAAGNATALLASSTISGNHFYTDLSECIDVPMVLTHIERNQFGLHGSAIYERHRHIHSVYPGDVVGTNANWVVGNQFSSARGGQSVLFEQGAQLHILGNQFEANEADTTLTIKGMFQVVIEGNYFERNAGDAMMDFANGLNNQLGNWIVRLENNFYNMQGQSLPNKFIFLASGATAVYMGYEAGTAFSPAAELTRCDLFNAGYLKLVGPFRFNGYLGTQASGQPNPNCH